MKKLLFILILFTTITPLIFFEKLPFPFVTEKSLYFRFIVDLLLVVWAFVTYKNPDFLPQKNPLNLSLLFWGGVCLSTAIFGHDFHSSFWSNLERMEGFVGLFHILIFFFIISNSLKKRAEWNLLFLISCVVACLVVITGIIREHESLKVGERLFSSLGNPSYLGLYLLLHLFLGGFLLINYASKWRILIVSMILIFLIGILFSQSRSAVFGLLVGLSILMGFVVFSKNVSLVIRWGLAIFLIFSCLGVLAVFKSSESSLVKNSTFLTRFVRVATSSKTSISRLNNWKVTYEGFKEKPVLGWGQENYQYVFAKHFLPQLYDDAPWYDRSHNFLLDWLVSGGILGLFSFLAPFGIMVWFSIRNTQLSNLPKGLFMGVIGAYFANNFFGFDSLTSVMMIFSIIGYWQFESKQNALLLIPSMKNWGVLACMIVAIMSFYYGYLQPLRTSKQIYKIVQEPDLQQVVNQAQKGYENAIGTGTSDFAEQVAFLSEKVKGSNIANDLRNNYYQTVIGILQKENEKHPHHPRLLSLKSSIESDYGDLANAVKGFEEVKRIAPKRHINLMQLANVYIKSNQSQKALSLYDEAYKINHYGESYFFKSLLYSELNDTTNLFKTISQLDSTTFFQKLPDVRALYGKHQNLIGFVQEMDRREIASEKVRYTIAYSKEVYFMWTMAAYEAKDIRKSAELVFRYIYGLGEKLDTALQAQKDVLAGRNPVEYFK
jgi:O-antigen ligase/tetratricopeptide (TPR) repeat protein